MKHLICLFLIFSVVACQTPSQSTDKFSIPKESNAMSANNTLQSAALKASPVINFKGTLFNSTDIVFNGKTKII